jgi:thiol-disulfide isomerase/thioredoxin
MKTLRIAVAAAAFGAALLAAWPGSWNLAAAGLPAEPAATPAPDLAGATQWLNSPPLSTQALRGKVVLVEFWTRECINCLHVLPHTKALYERYKDDGLVVIGVHTPEYDEERDPASVRAAAARLGIAWPVAIDNDYRIWNAWSNRFWPALYLIDRDGRVVYRYVGEGGYDRTEAKVRQLLGKA